MADNLNFDDFDALVAQLASEQTDGEKPKESQGFKLHLGGKDYTFPTQAEAERALEGQFAKQQAELAAAQARLEEVKKPVEKEPEPPKPGEVPAVTKQFVEMLEKGNMEGVANLLLNNGVYGGKVENAAALMRELTTKTALMDRSLAETAFLQKHEDLQKDPQQFQIVQQAREYLGLGNTPEGLEAAYHYARGTGHIQAPQQTQPTQGGRPSAPPSPTRQAASTGNGMPQTEQEWAAFYRSLPDDKFNEVYAKAHGRNFGTGF
jgi:hypothetical protein